MLQLNESYDCYTVLLGKVNDSNLIDSVVVSIYDDDRDLALMIKFSVNIQADLLQALSDFSSEAELYSFNNSATLREQSLVPLEENVFGFKQNPDRATLEVALNKFCLSMGSQGFYEVSRRNDWH